MKQNTYAKFTPWLRQVNETLPSFVDSLRQPGQAGRYYPCLNGGTEAGKKISLGFSTFAARVYYMLNRLDSLPESERNDWANFLLSFQVEDCRQWGGGSRDNSFVDVPQIEYLLEKEKRRGQLPKGVKAQIKYFIYSLRQRGKVEIPYSYYVIMGESRQALATLAIMGCQSHALYRNFPLTREEILAYLKAQDWSKPWSAGARTAVLAFFLSTQAPRILDGDQAVQPLKNTVIEFLDEIVDRETGCYFIGQRPGYAQLVNGTHKVLTALDWLDSPIHFPDAIVDTVLRQMPSPEGCHLVDAVYPLFRCGLQTGYHRSGVKEYSAQLLEMIEQHYNPDGGFSYFIGKSQTSYYNLNISTGLPESDLHGSLLLTWALSMLVEMLDINEFAWKSFRP